VGSGSGGV
jgi:hypothetical protein